MASSCSASPFSANLRDALFFRRPSHRRSPSAVRALRDISCKGELGPRDPRRGESRLQEGLDRRNCYATLKRLGFVWRRSRIRSCAPLLDPAPSTKAQSAELKSESTNLVSSASFIERENKGPVPVPVCLFSLLLPNAAETASAAPHRRNKFPVPSRLARQAVSR